MLETENLQRGKLSVGMPSNVGSFFLFDKIIDFHKRFPNIEITIMTGSTSVLLNLLDSHKVDFVIGHGTLDYTVPKAAHKDKIIFTEDLINFSKKQFGKKIVIQTL